ncbi:MAG: type II toxin-antitoxin system VapC family toxin [Acidobacteria bacterium]|nr:type II toxin-antitoxin system VapC family toxin [Acidobacteriota bacterium]MCA1640581.1 type II toxin-antitoxin system VapC family toxin [Acidobacteriota bacterium]
MIYVLDACAMIAFLKGEAGADVVEKALLDADSQCLAHAINLCEIYYDFHRAGGESAADDAIGDIRTLGLAERGDFDEPFWKEVGKLKAKGKISLADCFAITLTNRVGGRLLTSDHHEMDSIAAAGICNITFIR